MTGVPLCVHTSLSVSKLVCCLCLCACLYVYLYICLPACLPACLFLLFIINQEFLYEKEDEFEYGFWCTFLPFISIITKNLFRCFFECNQENENEALHNSYDKGILENALYSVLLGFAYSPETHQKLFRIVFRMTISWEPDIDVNLG